MIHEIYKIFGSFINRICLVYWKLRDRIAAPDNDDILFVAHPDDDTLFFHTFIKEYKPYVVLLFTGWSVKRLHDFIKAMKYYGVRFRAYPTVSSDAYYDDKRRIKTEKIIASCIKSGNFKTVGTHNSTGEYGHMTHKLVHESVVKVLLDTGKLDSIRLLCPVQKEKIDGNPVTDDFLGTKQHIFEHIYTTEKWVITEQEAGTPVWFYNEKLEEVKI